MCKQVDLVKGFVGKKVVCDFDEVLMYNWKWVIMCLIKIWKIKWLIKVSLT